MAQGGRGSLTLGSAGTRQRATRGARPRTEPAGPLDGRGVHASCRTPTVPRRSKTVGPRDQSQGFRLGTWGAQTPRVARRAGRDVRDPGRPSEGRHLEGNALTRASVKVLRTTSRKQATSPLPKRATGMNRLPRQSGRTCTRKLPPRRRQKNANEDHSDATSHPPDWQKSRIRRRQTLGGQCHVSPEDSSVSLGEAEPFAHATREPWFHVGPESPPLLLRGRRCSRQCRLRC